MAKRGKGSAYEREICKRLSQWWSRKGEDDLFWRTHGSGARATVRTKAGKKTRGQYGDICAVDGRGRKFTKAFIVSLKRGYQSDTMLDLVDGLKTNKECNYSKFVEEAIRDQYASNSYGWLLIVKRNRRKDLIIMPTGVSQDLRISGARELRNVRPQASCNWDIRTPADHKDLTQTVLKSRSIWVTTLENFLNEVTRDHVIALLERVNA